MSNSVSFKNADHVIEQFGGIRPLASKLGVPVTTVQGWKKRNSIPETRWQEIQKLANEEGLKVADANDNQRKAAAAAAATASAVQAEPLAARPVHSTVRTEQPSFTKEKIVVKRGYSFAQGVLVTLVSVGVSIAALAVLFGPDFVVSNPGQRLAVLEDKVNNGGMGATGDSSGLAATLQQSQQALQDTINNTVMPRLNELQATMGGLGDPQTLSQLSANIESMQTSTQGQAQLEAAVTELKTLLTSVQGDVVDLDTALAAVQKENSVLSETIGKVSTTDLTAAAMLLALNQFRSSMDRQEPLNDDIALLKSVINPDQNPDLAASIDRLTPFAASGVMSAGGLQTELQGLAGTIVEARLKGDKAPWQDIARARLQQLFDVRNDGIPVMGTVEQKAVAQAQEQLASGDIAAARATLQALPEPSRQAAEPFLQKADQAIVARQVEAEVTRYFAQSLQGLTADTAPSTTAAPQVQNVAPPTTGITPVEPTTPAAEVVPQILTTPTQAPQNAVPTPEQIEGAAPATETAPAPVEPPAASAPAQQPEGAQPAPSAPSL